MFTRVQKKKMLNRTKLHLSVTKANTSFIIYNFMGKFNKKKKKVYLSTVILKGKLMFF